MERVIQWRGCSRESLVLSFTSVGRERVRRSEFERKREREKEQTDPAGRGEENGTGIEATLRCVLFERGGRPRTGWRGWKGGGRSERERARAGEAHQKPDFN